MKKVIIGLIALSTLGFSAKAKYSVADIKQTALSTVLEQETKQVFYNIFNSKVFSEIDKIKASNKNYDSTKFENQKKLYENALISILNDLGYESNIAFVDTAKGEVEFRYYIDKEMPQEDVYYFNDLLFLSLNNVYKKQINLKTVRYADKALQKVK